MRTTVNLDDDVVAAVKQLQRDRRMGLSTALNHLARKGLVEPGPRERFVQRTAHIGLRIDVTDVAEAIEQLDGLEHP